MPPTLSKPEPRSPEADGIPPLEPGDRLTAPEFRRRYEAMPKHVKAELIEGVVYMASPVRYRGHGIPHSRLNGVLFNYMVATLGVSLADNSTTRLDLDDEPQPDLCLLIDPSRGGRATISEDDYIEGGPELVAEISSSTVSIDMHAKRRLYARHGVLEYLVWRVRDRAIELMSLTNNEYVSLDAIDGTLRSQVFPGLWLDVAALLDGDLPKAIATLNLGLATSEHAAFVAELTSRKPSV